MLGEGCSEVLHGDDSSSNLPTSFFSLTYIYSLYFLQFKLQGYEEKRKDEESKKQNILSYRAGVGPPYPERYPES